ncbi:MAG TPA: PDZ domain-containing protein [candidate division Zixibacteria bacterium]|nr:PDZ domain-containing protein [candidate division Zixibacteria bacterium]
MNNGVGMRAKGIFAVLVFLLAGCAVSAAVAQDLNFEQLEQRIPRYTVIIDMSIEVSFGIHSAEQKGQYLGTVVTKDGLVIFDGTDLLGDNGMAAFTGISVKAEPTSVELVTLSGQRIEAEYIGTDQYTRIGFIKPVSTEGWDFEPVQFKDNPKFAVGDWLGLYMILPDFIDPPIAADVGMISALVKAPESFALTVGFSQVEMASVLYDEKLNAVGILGLLVDPSDTAPDGGIAESMSQYAMPLLGVLTGDRLTKLINDPPRKGEVSSGWLGIRLQALTDDMADFWGIDGKGGIIVNEVVKDSPAEEAGLEVGDIIVELNGQPIEVNREENTRLFRRAISELGPGTALEFTLLRPNGAGLDTLQMAVTLAEAPLGATDAPEYESDALEFKVRDLVFDDYMFFNQNPETLKGVFISELRQGGIAEVGGLHYGDVIQRIDSHDIYSVDDMAEAMEAVEANKPPEIIFFIWRDNRTMFVNIKTDW